MEGSILFLLPVFNSKVSDRIEEDSYWLSDEILDALTLGYSLRDNSFFLIGDEETC